MRLNTMESSAASDMEAQFPASSKVGMKRRLPWADLKHVPQADMAVLIARAQRFYVYVLCRQDGTPFYVGKGIGKRVFQHEADARNTSLKSHKLNLIRSLRSKGKEVRYALAGSFDDEVSAHALERELVLRYGRHDQGRGPLTNQTDGGEGASNPSEAAQARHRASLGGDADDPERRAANRFLASIAGPQASIPVKPWKTLRARAHLLRPSPGKPDPAPTPRMAKAIAASAVANSLLLSEGVLIPRRLVIDGIECAIENGCGGDMIAARLVEPVEPRSNPLEELLRLTKFGLTSIVALLGRDVLLDLGILEPPAEVAITPGLGR